MFGANGGAPNAISSINGGQLYGNRIINGAMEIDQQNGGASVLAAAGTSYLTDMFGASVSQASKLTFQQVVDAPLGLKNSLKVMVSAQYAPVAADVFAILFAIEGKDVIDFKLGTAGAATFTLSKWIKGSVPGTYCVALRNAAANRCYIGTIEVTASWSQVQITLQGDISGTWLTDNSVGLMCIVDLGSGSNYQTTAGAWQAGTFIRTAGSVTFVNQAAGSTLNITGVDCRLGSVAPSVFERRANELQLCQRYLPAFNSSSTLSYISSGYMQSAVQSVATVGFSVKTRVPPTGIAVSNAAHFTVGTSAGAFASSGAVIGSAVSVDGAAVLLTVAGATGGQGGSVYFNNASGQLLFTGCRLF
jgi:hypothetical protein